MNRIDMHLSAIAADTLRRDINDFAGNGTGAADCSIQSPGRGVLHCHGSSVNGDLPAIQLAGASHRAAPLACSSHGDDPLQRITWLWQSYNNALQREQWLTRRFGDEEQQKRLWRAWCLALGLILLVVIGVKV